jgi:hypothetical protein
LLAGHCALCDAPLEIAAAAWAGLRDDLLLDWAQRRRPFPCWGAVVFDGAPWPALKPGWPEPHRRWHRWVEAALPGMPDAA